MDIPKEATDCPKCGGSNTRRHDQETTTPIKISTHGLACDDCQILFFDGFEHLADLKVGDILYGYCGGWFGRDSFEDKRIEAIGPDWVICRDENGVVHTATCSHESYERDFNIRNIQDMLNKPENRKPMEG